jgi:hypothetical protein
MPAKRCQALPYPAAPCPALPCLALPDLACHAMPAKRCPATPCHANPNRALPAKPCHAAPNHAFPELNQPDLACQTIFQKPEHAPTSRRHKPLWAERRVHPTLAHEAAGRMRKRQTRFDATRGAVKHVCMELPRARSAGRRDAPWLCTRAPVVVAVYTSHHVLVNIDKRKNRKGAHLTLINQATTIGALALCS